MPDAKTMRDRARYLRRRMTPAERYVWKQIRKRRLGGYRFRRQFPLGDFILDFVCFEVRFVLELDGGQHDEQREYDELRTAWLETQGFHVVRYWNCQVLSEWESIAETILECLRRLPIHPTGMELDTTDDDDERE